MLECRKYAFPSWTAVLLKAPHLQQGGDREKKSHLLCCLSSFGLWSWPKEVLFSCIFLLWNPRRPSRATSQTAQPRPKQVIPCLLSCFWMVLDIIICLLQRFSGKFAKFASFSLFSCPFGIFSCMFLLIEAQLLCKRKTHHHPNQRRAQGQKLLFDWGRFSSCNSIRGLWAGKDLGKRANRASNS